MKQARAGKSPRPDIPPEGTERLPGGAAALLGDFPEPVLLADRRQRLAFLNRAAAKLLGDTVRRGDPCPICTQLAGSPLSLDGKERQGTCLSWGQSLEAVPMVSNPRWAGLAPLTATVSPIRNRRGAPAGCLIMLRQQAAELSNPVVQSQLAILSSLLENFPMPFFMVDPFLVLTHMNERMEKLTGYARSEAVGRLTCGDILNTIQCNTCDCVLKQVMETQKPVSGLRRVVRNREGQEVQVTISASIITDSAGRVIGGFEAVRDITPVVEAEKKLDLLTELSREGLMIVDEKQQIIFANTRMADIVRRPKEDLLGRHAGEVLSSQHLHMVLELSRLVEQGEEQKVQFCSLLDQPRVEGSEPRVFESCVAVSRLGLKTLTCIYLRDLTERIEMERELEKSNAFLQNIIRNSVDGIVVVDTKGVPLIFNEGAERILGYRAEEIVGNVENFRRFYPHQAAAEMMRRMRSEEYGPRDKLNTTRLTFINKNGEEVPVNFSATIIRERGEEVGSVGIFSDLREILKVHQELEATQSQLVHAEKIASLGRMAAGVAHEINNPLAGILIYAELLQRELTEAAHRENIEVIISQTMRCQQIVKRLLDFSRLSLGQQKLFDVNEVIHRSVELLSHQAFFHNIKVAEELEPALPQIVGDPGQLQQVFINLLLNAADAMNGSGIISIATRPEPGKDGVILTFRDTGCGIPPDVKDKIFEPFFTTKPPGKGTGLGLSIVYGVIQRHGGSIEALSQSGCGTTFTIRLPLESREARPSIEFERIEGLA